MKRFFCISTVLLAASALCAACSDDPEEVVPGEKDPVEVEHSPLYEEFFSLFDLGRPGLERAAAYYEQGYDAAAAEKILDYYRIRTGIDNPSASGPLSVAPTDAERERADKALTYEFYSNGSFKNYWDEAAGAIDWTITGLTSDEDRYQLHRHQWFVPQGKAFLHDRMAGDAEAERYARSWMDVYSDWLVQNPRIDGIDYSVSPTKLPTPEEQNSAYAWRALEAAHRVNAQCQLLYYFRNAESLTADWWCRTFLVNFADHVEWISHNLSADGNHRITQAQAVLTAGAIFPEFKAANEWVRSGNEILTGCFDQFFDDGMHYEFDFSYYLGALDQFWQSWNVINDIKRSSDSSALDPDIFPQHLAAAVEPAMYLMWPDYHVINMSDTRSGQLFGSNGSIMVKNLTHYCDWFPENSVLQWFATRGKSGSRPSDEDLLKCFPDAGYYAMRSGWDADAAMMVLKNSCDPDGKWHNQPDNGTFELYVAGRNFFPDSGCYAYAGTSTNKARAKFRRTRSHNTMTLIAPGAEDDEWGTASNIAHRAGKLLLAERNVAFDDRKADVLVTENQGYDNLKHRRAVFFVDGEFFVIVDEGIGSAAGDVRLHWHLTEGDEAVLDLAENGAHTEFADNNNILVRTFSPEAVVSKEFAGYVSYKEGEQTARRAYDVVQSKTSSAAARFVTVILPVKGAASEHTVDARFSGDFSQSGAAVEVTVDGRAYSLNYTLN